MKKTINIENLKVKKLQSPVTCSVTLNSSFFAFLHKENEKKEPSFWGQQNVINVGYILKVQKIAWYQN